MEVRVAQSTKSWPEYNPQSFEGRWQQTWETQGLYTANNGGEKQKFYCLDFFPYPSGEGLHVGHCRNYIPTDVMSRYKRMRGFNVLHPMGWDAFGEPAEQHAVRLGVHPRITTDRNKANYRRQMTMIGTSYDWEREIDSSLPEYYRWNQYFFLLLYQRGLAYRDTNWQWWCDGCQTTLSSHEIAGGVCWRGHTEITKREIPAWYFRITAYAEELISGLDTVDWPESIKAMQRNWIGRSEGCEIIFRTQQGEAVPVFTTRPDTVFGATFFVLAPEHRLAIPLTTSKHRREVEDYIEQAKKQSEVERMVDTRQKTGVSTGSYVINPINGEQIPVFIADYVLMGYGTGAVMGVPAHDQRDLEFARLHDLPVRVVISPPEHQPLSPESITEAYTGDGMMLNSGVYDGLSNQEGSQRICADLAVRGDGGPKVSYRVRDWLISRQRYWGTPIPIVYCEECGERPVPEDQLPVLLPPMEDFQPDGSGRSPLARLPDFVNTTCPSCGGMARRETDTMGGFADSSWYFLRFTSPHYADGPFDPMAVRYWMPVDLYVGGAEHAVLHLLYARFWIKVMADAGLVSFREPFAKLLNQGQLLGLDGQRMAKSRGNVITPDSIVDSYGADSLRIYEMFMAPFDQDIAWSTEGIIGARRFLNRVWNLYNETFVSSEMAMDEDLELLSLTHKTIRRVEERIESFRFNTMVSALMEFVNALSDRFRAVTWKTRTYHQALEKLLVLMAPGAPHIAEELWSMTGHEGSVHRQPWPAWQADLARDQIIQIPVQVDGRLREVIEIPMDEGLEDVKETALTQVRVKHHLQGRHVAQVIYVPGKIINIVTR
jgi:leucyl-tRNA synthetase